MQITGQDIEVFYTYDALNLTNIQVTNTTSGDLDFPFTYDVTGLRNSVAYPNGVLTEYGYYPDGSVYSIAVSNSSGALETLTYTYDVSGNRKSMTRDGVETRFPSAFTNTPVYNAANRLTSFNGNTVLYDDNGNMTSWGSTSFTWNVQNQLIAINGPSLDASFTYDAVGRRIAKTINGTTTKYLYDGADIVMEMDGNGTPDALYLYGPLTDEPLARIDLSSGEIRYYHADALGSTIALTDENSAVVTQYNYSPFGKTQVIGSDSTGMAQPFRYTGREWDGDTELYFYRARYYSPEMARFISEDPIGLAGGINMYVYVSNAPLNFVDPLGLTKAPGFWESLIPIWGSGKQALHEFECGRTWSGLFYTAMAVSDVFLVKSAYSALAKGAFKIAGSHTWSATSKWLTKQGWRAFKGQHMHHWLIPKGGWGRRVPKVIKNQPWNLLRMSSREFHLALHGHGEFNAIERLWHGIPTWFKLGTFSSGGRVVQNW